MKNYLLIFLLLFLPFPAPLLNANNNIAEQSTLTIKARVVAEDSRQPLNNASIAVEDLNISTVSNQDGFFSLRVPGSARKSTLIIRFLGYDNKELSVELLTNNPDMEILMTPSPIALGPLEVVSGDGSALIRDALRLVPQNYSSNPEMMVAFYRESIKKGSNYISLVEAVLDIYKASYRSYNEDQAKIYIGRKATDVSPRDTVLMKFQGGISAALMLDLAKHPEIVFGELGEDYSFHIERMININNKPHYVIRFQQMPYITEILFRGTIYLDAASLAFARVEFNMNVEGGKEASRIFIRKKPAKMKADVEEVGYVVDFIEQDGKWHFNYSSTDLKFKVRWTNRFFGLFSTTYTISSEIAITDRYENGVNKFPRNERIRSSDVIAEKVEHFRNPDFWGDYNVIEPDIEITKAINKLSNKLLRRNQ